MLHISSCCVVYYMQLLSTLCRRDILENQNKHIYEKVTYTKKI